MNAVPHNIIKEQLTADTFTVFFVYKPRKNSERLGACDKIATFTSKMKMY